MRFALDSIALAQRARVFASNRVREMMRQCKVVLAGEDRDAVERLTSDAFAMGFLACLEAIEDERTVRDGSTLVRALHRKAQLRSPSAPLPGRRKPINGGRNGG